MFWYIFLPPVIIYFVFWIMSFKIQPKYRIVEYRHMCKTVFKVQQYNMLLGWCNIENTPTLPSAEFVVYKKTRKPEIRVVKTYKG